MKALKFITGATFLLFGFAVMAATDYVFFGTSMFSPMVNGVPVLNLAILGICGLGVIFSLFTFQPQPATLPRHRTGTMGEDLCDLHPPVKKRRALWQGGMGFIGLAMLFYLTHISIWTDSVSWADAYWPIILSAVLAAASGYWLYDTFAAPIINGHHSGKSQAALRGALAVKRLAIFAVVATFLMIFGAIDPNMMNVGYRSLGAIALFHHRGDDVQPDPDPALSYRLGIPYEPVLSLTWISVSLLSISECWINPKKDPGATPNHFCIPILTVR